MLKVSQPKILRFLLLHPRQVIILTCQMSVPSATHCYHSHCHAGAASIAGNPFHCHATVPMSYIADGEDAQGSSSSVAGGGGMQFVKGRQGVKVGQGVKGQQGMKGRGSQCVMKCKLGRADLK